jgi:nucleoside phosphorylase
MFNMKVLILTPLPLEYDAVVKHLTGERESFVRDTAAYVMGTFLGKHHKYSVVICEPGMKNIDMALATEKAIREFQPQIVLLVGIAGGVKDVQIGDVIIASSAFIYDAGKESESGFQPRPAEYVFSENLLAYAKLVSREPDWKKRTSDGAPDATVLIGPIAAGDKVVADVNNPTYQRIKQNLSHIKALEMEAAGFGRTIQSHRALHALVIRGISDMCEDKAETDKQNWQPVAADRAAAVAFELLYGLNASTFIIPLMDTKTLAKDIYTLLFPSTGAFQGIQNDFAGAANSEIKEIWKRIKPLFVDEIAELQRTPDDPDAQADVRNKLKKELDKQEGLQQELNTLLEKAKQADGGASVSIVNSKNVVSGSNINVGGDFRLGDG